MDVLKLVEVAFPARPDESVLDATGRADLKALHNFIKRWSSKTHIPYGELVKFGCRRGGPGLVLVEHAQQSLYDFFTKRTHLVMKHAVAVRVGHSLNYVSYRGWQACLEFDEAGKVRYVEGREKTCGGIKGLREEFLKE